MKAFIASHPNWPGNLLIEEHVPYLESVARRMDDDQPLVAGLERLFRDPLMADVWLVELKDHKRDLHSLGAGVDGHRAGAFQIRGGIRPERKNPQHQGQRRAAGPRPQVALSEKALQILAGLNGKNWDDSFHQLIAEVWSSDVKGPRIDPLLKLKLLQQTVEVGARGSYQLEGELAQQIKLMQGSKVSPIANWLEPDDAEANAGREQATRELDQLAKTPPATKVFAERAAQAAAPLGKPFQWVGWLRAGSTGGWQCASNQPLPQSGKLYVLGATGEKETLHAIGHLTPKGAEITATGPAMVEGRPVYVVAPND